MTADVSPSLRAVKKAEPNMAIPAKIKETAQIEKPCAVISSNAASYPTKIPASGFAISSDTPNINADEIKINAELFFSKLFSSFVFPAP